MSILSDSEIALRCVIPKFVIQVRNQVFLTHSSLEEIQAENAKNGFTDPNGPEEEEKKQFFIYHRELNVEEKANFKPMISPFVDHQVKTILRDPTPEERNYWESLRNDDGSKVLDKFVLDNLDIGLQVKEKCISWGLSSSGYDLRIAPEFKIFSNINSTVVDPKNFDMKSFVDFNGPEVIIPPNSFVLGRSLERFSMPRDVCAIVVGKSTLARVGINCLCTPLENEWEGYLTLEFANTTPLPVKLYANEGGCQVMFFKNATPPTVSYADRNGKYSNQAAEITLPRV